jgi:hypothetical protein
MMFFATPTRAEVAGKIYEVTIKNVNEPTEQAKACIKFENTNTMQLTEAGESPISFTFAPSTPAQADKKSEFRWQAVSEGLGMSGSEKIVRRKLRNASELLNGNIISQDGETFTFQGRENRNCTPPTEGESMLSGS